MDDAICWSSVLSAPGTNTIISNGRPAPRCSTICKHMIGDCFCPCATEQSQSSGQPPFLPQLLPDLEKGLLSGLPSATYSPESNLCMRSRRKKKPSTAYLPTTVRVHLGWSTSGELMFQQTFSVMKISRENSLRFTVGERKEQAIVCQGLRGFVEEI